MSERIIQVVKPGIVALAGRWSFGHDELRDDLIQEGMHAVCIILRKYEGHADRDVIRIAGRASKNAMISFLRKHIRYQVSEEAVDTLDHRVPTTDAFVSNEDWNRLEWHLRKKPNVLKLLQELQYPSDRTIEIAMETGRKELRITGGVLAKSLGISPATVSRRLGEIRALVIQLDLDHGTG